jgi:hypothetical protein
MRAMDTRILNTLKNNTQCCGVVVTPVNLLRALREHLGRGWLVVGHPFGAAGAGGRYSFIEILVCT